MVLDSPRGPCRDVRWVVFYSFVARVNKNFFMSIMSKLDTTQTPLAHMFIYVTHICPHLLAADRVYIYANMSGTSLHICCALMFT